MLDKIVAGGQTGADRAALDWAIRCDLPHGGWCPQGRWAEDGPISPAYLLTETPSSDPAQRTQWNVRDSDATALFSLAPTLSGGSRLTAEYASVLHKPWLHISLGMTADEAAKRLTEFLDLHSVRVLNVAGPRASEEPGIGAFVWEVLVKFGDVNFQCAQPLE